MFRIQQTDTFAEWLANLRDAKGKARILARLELIAHGSLGDTKSGGDKSTQKRDIERAKRLLRDSKED